MQRMCMASSAAARAPGHPSHFPLSICSKRSRPMRPGVDAKSEPVAPVLARGLLASDPGHQLARDLDREPFRIGLDLHGVEGARHVAPGHARGLGLDPGADRAARRGVAHARCRKPHMGRVLRRQREQRHRYRARHVFEIPRPGAARFDTAAADRPGRPRGRRQQHGYGLASGETHGERQVRRHRQHQQRRQGEADIAHPAQRGIEIAAPHQPTNRRRWLGGVAFSRSTKSGRNQ